MKKKSSRHHSSYAARRFADEYKQKHHRFLIRLDLYHCLGIIFLLMIAAIVYAFFQRKPVLFSDESEHSSEKVYSTQGEIQQWEKILPLTEEDIHYGTLILVNQKHPCQDYSYRDMLSVYDYKSSVYMVADKNLLLREPTILALNNMLNEFYRLKGKNDILVCSGFRSPAYQETLLQQEIEISGETASQWVASPGYSEHHTGYALDFNLYHDDGTSDSYTGTGIYNWVNENAPLYGFIVRYEPEKFRITGIQNEPWHFRYVGKPHSCIMKEMGYCLEEYIRYLHTFSAEDKHLFWEDELYNYEIYHCKDQLFIGKADSYTFSGDNIDGCIVTLKNKKADI